MSDSLDRMTFDVPHKTVRPARFVLGFFALLAIGSVVNAFVLSAEGNDAWPVMLVCAAVFIGLASLALRPALSPRSYAIELGSAGIGRSGGPFHPWTTITRLRIRPFHHRVELLREETVLVALEYQLEHFPFCLQTALANTGHTRQNLSNVYRFPPTLLVLGVGLSSAGALALAVAVYIEAGSFIGLVLPAIFILAAVFDYGGKVIRVEFTDSDLTVYRGRGVTPHPYSQIRRIAIHPLPTGNGQSTLALCMKFEDGRTIAIPVPHQSLFEVYEMLGQRCPDARIDAA